MARLTNEKIAEIQKIYRELGTYSGTAKVVGCSPATVKKYTSLDIQVEVPKQEVIPFSGKILAVEDLEESFIKDFKNWGVLKGEEFSEIQELWKEM